MCRRAAGQMNRMRIIIYHSIMYSQRHTQRFRLLAGRVIIHDYNYPPHDEYSKAPVIRMTSINLKTERPQPKTQPQSTTRIQKP